MLNRTSQATQSRRGAQPTGLPFFKPEHASTDPRTLTILMARAEKDRWDNDSVMLKIRFDGKLFLWQPNLKNPNFETLIDILGQDESKWPNEEVLAYVEIDRMTERPYLRIKAKDAKKK